MALAGCLGSGGDRGATTTTLDPSPVTTIGGDDVEVTAAQLLVREADDGPRVHYRLHNRGDADATVAIRTVLEIHEGGTYEATAYLDVPAGDAAFVEYRVVRYAALAEEEAENVRRGNTDFDVYVNGERRSGV